MDLGSGAGLPGIPLAIMRQSLDFVLLEPKLGRLEFLEAAVTALELGSVTPVCAAARELGSDHRGVYGIVLTRAVGKLRELIPTAAPFLAPDGALLAYKGPTYHQELESLPRSASLRLREVRDVELPVGHGVRHLLVFRRT
jgi:16S rRNA (guanine527-N7)-methyltransferase